MRILSGIAAVLVGLGFVTLARFLWRRAPQLVEAVHPLAPRWVVEINRVGLTAIPVSVTAPSLIIGVRLIIGLPV